MLHDDHMTTITRRRPRPTTRTAAAAADVDGASGGRDGRTNDVRSRLFMWSVLDALDVIVSK